MKKPNITEGEWKYKINSVGSHEIGTGFVCGAHPEVAATNTVYFNNKEREANAKAISAVPEMIDALLTAYEIIWELKNGQAKHLVADVELEEIKQALEKAGVQL